MDSHIFDASLDPICDLIGWATKHLRDFNEMARLADYLLRFTRAVTERFRPAVHTLTASGEICPTGELFIQITRAAREC